MNRQDFFKDSNLSCLAQEIDRINGRFQNICDSRPKDKKENVLEMDDMLKAFYQSEENQVGQAIDALSNFYNNNDAIKKFRERIQHVPECEKFAPYMVLRQEGQADTLVLKTPDQLRGDMPKMIARCIMDKNVQPSSSSLVDDGYAAYAEYIAVADCLKTYQTPQMTEKETHTLR